MPCFRNFKFMILGLALASGVARANSLGLQAGLDFYSLSFTNPLVTATNTSTTNVLIGGYYEFSMSPLFSLQPEVMYRGAGDGGDWVEIPFLFRFNFATGSVWKPFVYAGPALGIKLSNTNYKSTDFQLQVGGGVQYEITPQMSLQVSGRYSNGLTDINNTGSTLLSVKSKDIYLLAGIVFTM